MSLSDYFSVEQIDAVKNRQEDIDIMSQVQIGVEPKTVDDGGVFNALLGSVYYGLLSTSCTSTQLIEFQEIPL